MKPGNLTNSLYARMILMIMVLFNPLRAMNQSPEPDALLKRMKQQLNQVKDYQAHARILVDVSFINIPEREATVYFKQPSHMHVDTKGFTLLPRRGMSRNGMDMLEKAHTAIAAGEKEIRGTATQKLKVIPQEDEDVVLTEIWIDPERALPMRMKTFTKARGSFTMDFFYDDHPYNLPDKLEVGFTMKDKKFPAAFTGNFESMGEKVTRLKDKKTKGRVTIHYSNYKVNQGLSDDLFSEKRK